MGLIDLPGRVRAKRLEFAGRDLLALSDRERRALVGKDIAMIFQEPLASLNPCYTVAFQLMETLRIHEGGSAKARAGARAGAAAAGRDSRRPGRGSTPTRTSCPAAWRSA